MQKLRKLIHSPHHLFVFEVSARLSSFTKAAEELGVSQPAISLAIKQFESSIGLPLFERGHRKISLTAAGERLYEDVSIGLGRILQTANELHHQLPPSQVTLSVSTAFANYWVMPRLSGLHAIYPDIDLRLQVVDKDSDLENENVSLGIRRGKGNWPGYHSSCIAAEQLLIVGSSNYLNLRGVPANIPDLLNHQFIHLEEPYRPRPRLKDWFNSFGFDYVDNGEGLRLNDYALVIQAAMSGEGLALGWKHVVDPLINSGLLVQVIPESWITGEEFHLIWSDKINLSTQALQVRDWIIKESSQQPD